MCMSDMMTLIKLSKVKKEKKDGGKLVLVIDECLSCVSSNHIKGYRAQVFTQHSYTGVFPVCEYLY